MISVLGVFNADLKFKVERFPEPGETLHGLAFDIQPGGKGFNQAVACRRAMARGGDKVTMLTQLGEDNLAQMARDVMTREAIDTSHVMSSDHMPTGTAMIMVEENTAQNMIVISPGAASLLGEEEIHGFGSAIETSKFFITNFEVPMVAAVTGLRLACAKGVTTLLDPAPATQLPDTVYRDVDIITPNESEAAILVGHEVITLEDGVRAAKQLCARGVGTSVITMGDKGVVAVSKDEVVTIPAFKLKQVVDTTGAGDAFNGCFAARLAQGAQLKDAIRFASAGAALCVGKYGAADAMATRSEIDNFLAQNGSG